MRRPAELFCARAAVAPCRVFGGYAVAPGCHAHGQHTAQLYRAAMLTCHGPASSAASSAALENGDAGMLARTRVNTFHYILLAIMPSAHD